jgi:hypothetical protein
LRLPLLQSDDLIIHRIIIIDMEAYETAIQEAVEASQGYIVTFGCTYKPGNGIWIHRAQRDDVISFRKNQQVSARDFIAKEIFFGTAECFVLRQEFCWKK